jgi:anti-sigma regulatory factor (Ser/Thr protein kinase)
MTGDDRERTSGCGPAHGTPSAPAVLEQTFDAGSLYALRSAVAAHAAAAGLSPGRVYDVVAAAHELAANAVLHGAGHGRLRLRAADGVLACQVTDGGPADSEGENPGAGAPWPAEHGHGLWLIGQVASQFTIDRGPVGTTATAVFTLRPAQ